MNYSPDDPGQNPRRAIVAAATAVALLSCGIFALLATLDTGQIENVVDNVLDVIVRALPAGVDPVHIVGWFLLAEGSLTVLGSLAYLALRLPNVDFSPQAEEIRERMRSNLSAQANAEAQRQLEGLRGRILRRGVGFIFSGLISLFIGGLLLFVLFPQGGWAF